MTSPAAERHASVPSVRERPGAAVWVAALLPLFPPLFALSVYPMPDDVVRLDGEWRALEADIPSARVDIDDSTRGGWHTYTVPGGWTTAGMSASTAWLRKHFTIPPEMRGRDLFLVAGHMREGFATVYINGTFVGENGVPAIRGRMEQSGIDGFAIPATLFGDGEKDNVIAMRVQIAGTSHVGIDDRRWFIGTPEVAKVYYLRNVAAKSFLESGALFLILFAAGLIVFLYLASDDKQQRRLYLATLGLQAACAYYLANKTGVPFSFFLSADMSSALIGFSVLFIGAATPEFVETYYVGRTTLFRKINRVVCAVSLLTTLLVSSELVFMLMSNWLLVVVAHALFFAVRDIIRPTTRFGPVFASSLLVAAICGGNDLITDIDRWFTPRLFTFAVGDLAMMVGAVVVAEFLKLSQTAAESARLKSEFLANTSHELRTPLNAIINIPQGILEQFEERTVIRCRSCDELFELENDDDSALAAEEPCPSCAVAGQLVVEVHKLAPSDPDALAVHLQSVVGAGQHLLAVVDDILDFAKLDAGRLQLNLAPTRIADVVARAIDTVAPTAAKNGVALRVLSPVDPALVMQADELRLRQVLINLLTNAVKLSPAGASVDIGARAEPGRAGELVVLSVRDQGPGIAAEHHGLIFESFRQIEGGHTRKHGGTGLGLAIVKELIELHDGTIEVESELGKGATFTVRLPAVKPARPSAGAPTSTPA